MLNTSAFFNSLCKNAKHNGILIMDTAGAIIEANQAFLFSFGYSDGELTGQHLRVLFTEDDKKINRPEREVEKAIIEGSSSDDNYLVQKSGKPVWVNGESVLVNDGQGNSYIIKIVHDIEAQKQLERFLSNSNDFIETVLESVTNTGIIVLDTSLKVVKANSKFAEMFGLDGQPKPGTRVSTIAHPVWNNNETKQLLRNLIVHGKEVTALSMDYEEAGRQKRVELTSKFLHNSIGEKRILLVFKPLQE